MSKCRKNTVKQTKYVNKVTNGENRIKTKWKFCTKKILRSRAQNDNITSSKRTQKQKTIKNKKMNKNVFKYKVICYYKIKKKQNKNKEKEGMKW